MPTRHRLNIYYSTRFNDHEDLIIVSEFSAGLLLNYSQIKTTTSRRHAIKFFVFDIQRTVHRDVFL